MRENALWSLIVVFVPFSLVSIGGGPSIFAGIQHQSVEVYHWVTAREFVDLFAIARAAPGPGSMLVTLLGWKVAGWTGAIVATLALFVPSSLALLRRHEDVEPLPGPALAHGSGERACADRRRADPGRRVRNLSRRGGGHPVLGRRRRRGRDPGLAPEAQPADPARGRCRRLRNRHGMVSY